MDEKNQSSATLPLTLIGLVALVYRIIPAWGHLHKADAVVIGFMADDIAHGRAAPIVHYGSRYMGSIEAWLMAPFFYFFGPHWWEMAAPIIMVSTLGVIPFFLLGRSYGGLRSGYAAALLWAISPFALNYYTITPRGPYPEVVAGGTLLLWYAVELLQGRGYRKRETFLYGLLMGVLLWTSLIAAPYLAVVAVAFLMARRNKILTTETATLITGFLVGVSPFVSIMTASLQSVGHSGAAPFAGRGEALINVVTELFIPYASMEPPFLVNLLGWGSLLILVGSLLCWYAVAPFTNPQSKAEAPAWPLLLFGFLFVAAFLINDRSLSQQARYVLPLFSGFIIATAFFFELIRRRSPLAGLLFLLIPLSASASNNWLSFTTINHHGAEERKLIEHVYTDLKKSGVKSVIWVDYERAHLLDFEAMTRGEEMAAMSYEGARINRLTWREEADPDTAVIFTGTPDALRAQVRSCCGENFRETRVAKWPTLYQMRPTPQAVIAIPPARWRLTKELARLADRRFSTTFVSNTSFTIELKEPVSLARIRAIYGGRQPAKTAIMVSTDGTEWKEIAPLSGPSLFVPYGPKLYVRTLSHYDREHQEWRFPPVMARFIRFIIDHPADSLYDIHELFLYKSLTTAPPIECDASTLCPELTHKPSLPLIAADRWITANLRASCPQSLPLIVPSFEYRSDPNETSHWQTVERFTLVMRPADLKPLLRRLDGWGISHTEKIRGSLTLVSLSGPSHDVWWTGFTLIDY